MRNVKRSVAMAETTMDAITLLTEDHKGVKKLFREFEGKGDRATKAKVDLYQKIKMELEIHTEIEEQFFYPASKEAVSDMVAEAMEEHKQVDTLLQELQGMNSEDERFDAKMTVLIENVEHHADEEEKEMFPAVKKALGAETLRDLGGRMMAHKQQRMREMGQRAA
jgi:hemerythrin superfamily protein